MAGALPLSGPCGGLASAAFVGLEVSTKVGGTFCIPSASSTVWPPICQPAQGAGGLGEGHHAPALPRASPAPQDRQRRAEWRVGTYVRVHGHLSSVGREKSMVAFSMRLVTDYNEVRALCALCALRLGPSRQHFFCRLLRAPSFAGRACTARLQPMSRPCLIGGRQQQ